jgi:hypothetical protein
MPGDLRWIINVPQANAIRVKPATPGSLAKSPDGRNSRASFMRPELLSCSHKFQMVTRKFKKLAGGNTKGRSQRPVVVKAITD